MTEKRGKKFCCFFLFVSPPHLAKSLLVENNAAYVLAEVWRCEEQLAIREAICLVVFEVYRREPLADGPRGLVGGENSFARRHKFGGDGM